MTEKETPEQFLARKRFLYCDDCEEIIDDDFEDDCSEDEHEIENFIYLSDAHEAVKMAREQEREKIMFAGSDARKVMQEAYTLKVLKEVFAEIEKELLSITVFSDFLEIEKDSWKEIKEKFLGEKK